MTENQEENPNYYAVLPANVRYDKRLSASEKLLYGEISALTQKNGYCWASNKYFAELHGLTIQSISRMIKNLCEYGYIESQIIYKEGSKEIDKRYIKLCVYPINKNVNTPINKNVNTPINKNVKDNNTSINNTSINKEKIVKKENPTYEEVLAYAKERNNTDIAKKFYDYFTALNWVDSKGNKVKNWKAKFIQWEMHSKPKEKPVDEFLSYVPVEWRK